MEEAIFNNVFDHFEEEETDFPVVHLRIQKRNAKKTITIIEGLDQTICKTLIKDIRKRFNTNGTLKKDDEDNSVLQIQGDKRLEIKDYLVTQSITAKEKIFLHGY